MATLTGTNFQPGAVVTFDGQPAASVVWVSPTQITCSPPAHAAGAVDVKVINPDGTNATLVGGYTYGSFDPTLATSANLRGWYKSDVGFVAGTSWADQSTHGNNATVSGATVGATQNGRATVAFAAGSSQFASVGAFSKGSAGGLTIGAVVKVTDVTAIRAIASLNNNAFDVTTISTSTAGKAQARNFSAAVDGTSVITNTWTRVLLTSTHPGSDFLYVNNVQEATQANGCNLADGLPFYIGRDTNIGAFLTGLLGEMVVYDAALSSADRLALDNYFKDAWGL